MTEIQQFVQHVFSNQEFQISEIPKSGSERSNYIVNANQQKFVLTENVNVKENESFFYLSGVFAKLKLNTPKILAISQNRKMYLQDFVGENNLSTLIAKENHSDKIYNLVEKTMQNLVNFQKKSHGKVDFSKGFEYEVYDELPITHDLYYFKNFLVDVLEIHYSKSALLKEFKLLSKKIENLQPKGVMIRDFQARNIMVNQQNDIFFIDYQSAMQGPLLYDVVSFLYQAKAQFPDAWKQHFIKEYFKEWQNEFSHTQLQESLEYCQFIRFVQVLGAYAFRGLIQRKSHFIESLTLGLNNLVSFCENWTEMPKYPEFQGVIQALKSEKYQEKLRNLIEGN